MFIMVTEWVTQLMTKARSLCFALLTPDEASPVDSDLTPSGAATFGNHRIVNAG